ncbi:MAG: hypothetical protein AAFN09_08855 [Pseudomonadota bacterium]
MKNPIVAIGLTTYDDISSAEIARSVFRILQKTDARLCPEFVNWHEPINVPVNDEAVWLEYWSRDAVLRLHGSAMDTKLGGLWRRRRSVQSWGCVSHASTNGWNDDSTLSLSFRWNASIDWWHLFSSLCNILNPAYGMLHLFTDTERKLVELCNFDGPVVGEGVFTNKLSKDGNVIGVDRRKRTNPMQYCYIPELSWGNCFGVEFKGVFNPECLTKEAAFGKVDSGKTLIRITESLDDILNDHENFCAKRAYLRSLFRTGAFRDKVSPDDARFSYRG